MTEPLIDSQPRESEARPLGPHPQTPSLSSTAVGWKGLVVQASSMPREIESLIMPASPTISFTLFTGGALHLEYRPVNGKWQGAQICQGDLSLNTNAGAYQEEIRCKSLSGAPTQTLNVSLSRHLLARTAQEVLDMDLTSLSLPARVGFQDPLLMQIGLALWRELEQPFPAGNLYAQSAAHLLAVHLLRHYTSRGEAGRALLPPSRGLSRHQITQVLGFIQAHLSQDLSLEDLAGQVDFSPSHFARLFRQTTGESPHRFVLHQRIERAKSLLQETDVPLIEIAAECGFASQSHLTQVFKDHLGLTPRAYRSDC